MQTGATIEFTAEQLAWIDERRTLHLATIDANGMPMASYAPFVFVDGCFYVYVSQLASHSQGLARPAVGVMLIDDESVSDNLFARVRIMAQCRSEVVPRESDHYAARLDLMQQRLGSTMKVLRTLADFTLFELQPFSGRWVTGFGAAEALKVSEASN